jgi:hypothetical protein
MPPLRYRTSGKAMGSINRDVQMSNADSDNQQTNEPTREHAAAPPPAQPLATGLLDVSARKPRFPWFLLLLVVVIGIAGAIVAALTGIRQQAYFVLIGITIAVSLMLLARLGDRAVRRKMRSVVQDGGDDVVAMALAASQRLRWPSKVNSITELARLLAKRGEVGRTIRMQWRGTFSPVEPLAVVFEARLMDESDAAFMELEAATTSHANAAQSSEAESRAAGDDAIGVRKIHRNVKLRGGWAFVVMFAFFTLQEAVESYMHKTISWKLPFFSLMLLLILVGPDRGLFASQTQWLLAPGGLFVRKAVRRSTRSQLHLFDRRKSVLCLSQERKARWFVAVADAEAHELTAATEREVHFLLRAWLSPLEPPPADRLTDLT